MGDIQNHRACQVIATDALHLASFSSSFLITVACQEANTQPQMQGCAEATGAVKNIKRCPMFFTPSLAQRALGTFSPCVGSKTKITRSLAKHCT